MRILFCIVFLSSFSAFAEEDLFAKFDRTNCKTDVKTKEVVCTLDGKKVPSGLDKKKLSAEIENDDELDVVTE
ncbi:MAG: hypothetical protein ACXWC9_05270 [Pseudobdellovibrionaceae bacterium]